MMKLALVLGLMLATLTSARAMDAGEALDAVLAQTPSGVTGTVLLHSEIAWPESPTGGWATSVAFQRYRLEPGEIVTVRSNDNAGPGSDVLHFAQGSMTLVNGRGGERPFREGATLAVDRRDAMNPGYQFAVRNDGSRCAVLLQLSTHSCNQCGGGPLLSAVPPIGPTRSYRCDEPVKAPTIFGRGVGETASFALRVVMDPGAKWDFGDRLRQVVIVVDRGDLDLGEPGEVASTLRTGDIAEIAEGDTHELRNTGTEPAELLVVGAIHGHGGHSVLEVRRSACPPGAERPYLLNCRQLPEGLTPVGMQGPSGYREFQLATPDAGSGANSGASTATFRGLIDGRYHLTDEAAPEGSRVAISCVESDSEGFGDGPLIVEFNGEAKWGIDVDLAEGAHVVCYWYSGIS